MSRPHTPTLVLEDKRIAPRITTTIKATVIIGKRRVAFTVDSLSVTGARLIGPLGLARGQHIELELELNTTTVDVIGEVVRVDTPDLMADQIAVRFVDPLPEARVAIRELVARTLDIPQDEDERDTTQMPPLDVGEGRASGHIPTTKPRP